MKSSRRSGSADSTDSRAMPIKNDKLIARALTEIKHVGHFLENEEERRFQLFDGCVVKAEAALQDECDEVCIDAIYFLESRMRSHWRTYATTWKQIASTHTSENVRIAAFEAIGASGNRIGDKALCKFLAQFVNNDSESLVIRGNAYFALLSVLEGNVNVPNVTDAIPVLIGEQDVKNGVNWAVVNEFLE